jgi:hypothetical protein
MAAAVIPSTTGVLGLWDGTKDGQEDGYMGNNIKQHAFLTDANFRNG